MVRSSKFTSRDGGPKFALLNESCGGFLVQGCNGIGKDGDLALPGSQLSLQSDCFALQISVSCPSGCQGGFGVGELFCKVIFALSEGGLGGGETGLESGSLRIDGGGDGSQGGGGTIGGGLGGLDQVSLLMSVSAQELHLSLDGGGLLLGSSVGSLSGLTLGGSLGQDGLEFGQTFSHLLAAFFLSLLLLKSAHFSLDHGVEFVPGPVSASVVETNVPLDRGDALLLGDLALISDVDEHTTSLALHLHEDLGQSPFTNLLKGGQHTGAEHDLSLATTEGVGVHAGGNEGLGGTLTRVTGHVGEDLGGDDGVTGHEIRVGDLVGQTQHTNTDTFKYAIAVKLVHDKRSINVSRLLDL